MGTSYYTDKNKIMHDKYHHKYRTKSHRMPRFVFLYYIMQYKKKSNQNTYNIFKKGFYFCSIKKREEFRYLRIRGYKIE